MKASTAQLRRTGIIAVTLVLLAMIALFSKNQLSTALSRGETIKVHFAQDYKLRPHVSQVKLGFVPVGTVSGIDRAADGSAIVSVKVDDDVTRTLGSEPGAVIRPTTVLGGSYFVDLRPGGTPGEFRGESIPRERTSVPVELDHVFQALQPDALAGLQHTVGNLDSALDPRGRDSLERLVRTVPGTLRPGEKVLAAAQGTRPGRDLTKVVSNFHATAQALTARDKQLERIVTNLQGTTSALSSRSRALSTTLNRMPETLDNTRAGLKGLSTTLDTLEAVANNTRPVAKELGHTLDALTPVLRDARPAIRDLRYVARDARPVLANLVPTARSGRTVLDDVRGPVIDRVNGKVMPWLHAPYDGTGKYDQTFSKRPMYEETTFALVNVDRASALVDDNGHAIAFQPGIGAGSVGGRPISLEQFVKLTSLWNYPALASPSEASSLPAVGSTVNQLLNLLGGQ